MHRNKRRFAASHNGQLRDQCAVHVTLTALALRTSLSSDAIFNAYSEAGLIGQILDTLNQRGAIGSGIVGAQFVAGDLQAVAPTAQRYSFATPPSRSV
jgi:hypothetical protein